MKCGSIIIPGSKICFIAEAPGAEEERVGVPLVGKSGKEFDSMLADAGLERRRVSLSNIFDERPEGNDLNTWATSRKEAADELKTWPAGDLAIYNHVPCKKGVVEPKRTLSGLRRVKSLLESLRPNLIVALGNTPLAALTGKSGITKFRGTIMQTELVYPPIKVLPTFHPAAILRQYEWRITGVADLMKAKLESEFPEVRLKTRKLWLEPELWELTVWAERLERAECLSVDIETKAGQITCIGFAPSPEEAYVIPFWMINSSKYPGGNYWQTAEAEQHAWKAVKRILASPSQKLFQNGMYDVTYLEAYGILVNNFAHDTMLLHHALYPELPKALGFLGSIYANEKAWKQWRIRGSETAELKKEE